MIRGGRQESHPLQSLPTHLLLAAEVASEVEGEAEETGTTTEVEANILKNEKILGLEVGLANEIGRDKVAMTAIGSATLSQVGVMKTSGENEMIESAMIVSGEKDLSFALIRETLQVEHQHL